MHITPGHASTDDFVRHRRSNRVADEKWKPGVPSRLHATTHRHVADAIFPASSAACCNSEATCSTFWPGTDSQTCPWTFSWRLGFQFDFAASGSNTIISRILAIQPFDSIANRYANRWDDPASFRRTCSVSGTAHFAFPSFSTIFAQSCHVPASATGVASSTSSTTRPVPVWWARRFAQGSQQQPIKRPASARKLRQWRQRYRGLRNLSICILSQSFPKAY